MGNRLQVADHLTDDELLAGAKGASNVTEWRRWMVVRRFRQGASAVELARQFTTNPDWVRRSVRRYNAKGRDAFTDARKTNGRTQLLSDEIQAALLEAMMNEVPPTGGLWTALKVSDWLWEEHRKVASLSTIYNTLQRLGLSKQAPRPKSAKADPVAQDIFKKKA